VNIAYLANGEGRLFRGKGEPQIALTRFFQLDELTDKLNNIDSPFDFFLTDW
jgi:hypothetical protein